MEKLLTSGVNFGERLKQLRKRRGLTQKEMEIQLTLRGRTMVRSHYANIENGRSNLYIRDLMLLKEILQVEYADFFEGLTVTIDPAPPEE